MNSAKVTIKRNPETREVEITSTERLPRGESIAKRLPLKFRARALKLFSRGYTLEEGIGRFEDEIDYQVWADAISQTVVAKRLNEAGATAEMRNLDQGTYLAMGDTVYKLSAVQMAPQTKALAVARKMVVDKAKSEAEGLLNNAKETATALIAKAVEKRAEANRLLTEAVNKAGDLPPQWARDRGIIICYKEGRWHLRMQLTIQITHFDVEWEDADGEFKYSWPALLPESRIYTVMWVPVETNGTYNITSVYIDGDKLPLPHVDHYSACVSPGDAPVELNSYSDFISLRSAVVRTLQRVQLDSLRTNFKSWREGFKDLIPMELLKALDRAYDYDDAIKLAKELGPESRNDVKEEKETWTAITV